jgi:hypothetical protein
MNDNYNAFSDCTAVASEHGTGWSVTSLYWNLPMPNEAVARRVAEIIRLAYQAGITENQNAMRKALGIPEHWSATSI